MQKTGKHLVAAAVLLLGLGFTSQASKLDRAVWLDFDFKSIPEPKVRSESYYDYFFSSEMAESWRRGTDIPRGIRHATGSPKQASNVNTLDEVPDSSWYINRHALRHMTVDQLVRGPNRGDPPDFSHATITKAKLEGVTPGLQLVDSKGTSYLIKFDNKDYPELQSGAEVISTKILYAAGYNVPENYITYLDPEKLEIKPGVEIGTAKNKHPFTGDDLKRMLENAARRSDGSYRVLASKILAGVPKGPFAYVGMRSDDPNDIIPHEHRRELRGLRVIASWINHWDIKEMNTLDMYVDEGGRKFLHHFLIDFGSSLGGGKSPTEYFHGHEYAFDSSSIFKEIFTLGLYVSADEKSAPIVSPEVGLFSAAAFDPGGWKPSFHVLPFDNMTQEDAFWATRIVLSFTEDELRSIVKTAQYSDPKAEEYILRTLVERQRRIAGYWLKDVNPLANFSVDDSQGNAALSFTDLMEDHDLAGSAQYRYEVSRDAGDDHGSEKKKVISTPHIALGHSLSRGVRVKVWTIRDGHASSPVAVSVRNRSGGGYEVFRIERS
jgi:hypothetical protein